MKRFLTLVVFGALPTFALSLVNAPQAFADVKAVVTIECEPHFDTVAFADFSSSSPVQSPPAKCTDAMVFLDAAHFKVKETLRGVSATTINEFPGSGVGGTPAWHSNYLYVFFLD